jgi:hypothetical protein
MIGKVKAKFWNTDDGVAIRKLLHEHGTDPADTIVKAHGEAYAALGRLDA